LPLSFELQATDMGWYYSSLSLESCNNWSWYKYWELDLGHSYLAVRKHFYTRAAKLGIVPFTKVIVW